MTLLDHVMLQRTSHSAGLLPTDLARHLHQSVDTITAITERGAQDDDITLADLRRMAAAVGVSPSRLLSDGANRQPCPAQYAQLAALLHRDGTAAIDNVAMRLQTTPTTSWTPSTHTTMMHSTA